MTDPNRPRSCKRAGPLFLMDTTPYLWCNLDGSVVVSALVPVAHLPNNYTMAHRPATEHDLATLSFLKPEHDTRSDCDRGL